MTDDDGHWAMNWREEVVESLVRSQFAPDAWLWFDADAEHVVVYDDTEAARRFRMGTTARTFLLGEHDELADGEELRIDLLPPRHDDD
jgi:hypothetical protein